MENRHTEDNRKTERRDKAVTFANYSIRSQMVRLIAEDAPPKTILRDSAISYAKEQGLDLVQISYDKNAHLPVCKLLDYGKYKYEQSKREKSLKK
jgi:translation initiation factor IF-3